MDRNELLETLDLITCILQGLPTLFKVIGVRMDSYSPSTIQIIRTESTFLALDELMHSSKTTMNASPDGDLIEWQLHPKVRIIWVRHTRTNFRDDFLPCMAPDLNGWPKELEDHLHQHMMVNGLSWSKR